MVMYGGEPERIKTPIETEAPVGGDKAAADTKAEEGGKILPSTGADATGLAFATAGVLVAGAAALALSRRRQAE